MVEKVDPTRDIPGLTDYERPNTWPRELTELFDAHAEVLTHYERERLRIHRLCQDDILMRTNPPPNHYQEQRNRIVQCADEILMDESLLSFHCTRLTHDEIADIQTNGLLLLSTNTLQERIRRRVEAGDIPSSLSARLLNEHEADCEGRQGRLNFVSMRSELKSESGVGRLLRSWGGEALYNLHESDPETGPLLRRIGVPCIWIVALRICQIESPFDNVGERFVWAYLKNHGVEISSAADMEAHLTDSLPPDAIIDVVIYGNPAFEALTGCTTWHNRIV